MLWRSVLDAPRIAWHPFWAGAVSAARYGSIALDPRGEKLIVQFREWVGADIYTAQWPTR